MKRHEVKRGGSETSVFCNRSGKGKWSNPVTPEMENSENPVRLLKFAFHSVLLVEKSNFGGESFFNSLQTEAIMNLD